MEKTAFRGASLVLLGGQQTLEKKERKNDRSKRKGRRERNRTRKRKGRRRRRGRRRNWISKINGRQSDKEKREG